MDPQPPNDPLSPLTEQADVSLRELVGCTRYKGPMRTLEEMEGAIRRGALERFPGSHRKEPSC
jgi:hypothetical protein